MRIRPVVGWLRQALMISAFLLAGSWESGGQELPSKGKVAMVNGSVITQKDFGRAMGQAKERIASRGMPVGDSELPQIKQTILEALIDRELLLQESQKQGIQVDEAIITSQFNELKKRSPKESDFEKMLSDNKLSEADLKSQLREALAIQQFINENFGKKITVPETEIKSYYDSNPNAFKQPEQTRARHILIKVEPGADNSQRAEARKKLRGIQQRLQKGEDFSILAKENSQCPSSAKGGDLGYFRRGQMVKPFEEAALVLKPGEVSDIVETQFGYHLIKALDRKAEGSLKYEDVRDRLEQFLKRGKVQGEVKRYTAKLKEQAVVERFLP